MAEDADIPQGEDLYFKVSPLMLFPETHGNFPVYLRQDGQYVLYAGKSEMFSSQHKARLADLGMREVFVLKGHRKRFERYVEENLGAILGNDELPMVERAQIFYGSSLDLVKNALRECLPGSLPREQLRQIEEFVRQTAKFLSRKDALRSIGSLISHDFKVYRHSVNVFVFTTALLQTYDLDEKIMLECGVGAILHDIGKQKIPPDILDKPIGLSKAEQAVYQTHPIRGVAMVANLAVSGEVYNSILFHHERMDGAGYPSGLTGADIPFLVRILAVADRYESLVSGKSYREAMTPYQALRVMSEREKGGFDPEVVKRLVLVLSGAGFALG
ncbi:MAG: HD domain-containing phosphohydrolase, partial [Thermodesulfobacteriota bacterium]